MASRCGIAEIIQPYLAHKLQKMSNECPFLSTSLPLQYCTTLLFFIHFYKKIDSNKGKVQFLKSSL